MFSILFRWRSAQNLGGGWRLGLDLRGAFGSSTVFGSGKLSIPKQL